MTPAARYAAAIDVLDEFLDGASVDKVLSNWARSNRYAGSKDRAAVRDIVFDCLRNLRSFAVASGLEGGRGLVAGHCLYLGENPKSVFTGEGYAPDPLSEDEQAQLDQTGTPSDAERANLPDWIAAMAQADLGNDFVTIATALNTRAPVDLRVNLLKVNRLDAIKALASEDIEAELLEDVTTALRITKNPRRVAGSKAFSDGLIELQDAASQAIITLLDVQPDARVLDFCAGGGGKTLALAAAFPSVQIDAWDISAARLAPLGERAKRAGAEVRLLKTLPKAPKYDLVLVDAPCSGSGSWRRNPEGKWRLTQDRLVELQAMQNEVLRSAAACTKAGGILAYATCSIFTRENREQVDAFLIENPMFEFQKDHSFRVSTPGDGFYCAILKNNSGV
jgi:16S rRNA (cytosine967-C5)-methyltransferase